MQITLTEDDGIFFDGVPKNVILVVKFDDGKQIRVPYSAEKSISALYQDLQAIAPTVALNNSKISDELPVSFIPKIALSQNRPGIRQAAVDKSNVIEKEDIVTLVRLDEGRNKDASCDLTIGQEYRVIKVISTGVTLPGQDKITQMVQGYDVVNDSADRQERTRVYPNEVQLARKRVPPPEKGVSKVEEILQCPYCSMPNALSLEGDEFKGNCESCYNDISIKRIIKTCLTDKCVNEVALFDVGTKFKGVCTKCKVAMEVEYA